MRAVIQRVTSASVTIHGELKSQIGRGLVVFVAVEPSDKVDDADWLSSKIVRMRVFDDEQGVMNWSATDVVGEILAVSQFTLFASTRKGNRPSYARSAKAEHAVPQYERFLEQLARQMGKDIKTGEFGAHMMVSLVNDGPVTIIIDSKQRE